MATAPDCLTSLLGLTPKEAPCFPLPDDANRVATITASDTGFYLTMAEGLELRVDPRQTAALDLYERMENARALAVAQVRTELENGRGKAGGTPIYTQRGQLGGQGNGQLMPPGTRALLTFRTNRRNKGEWLVTKVSLYTDQAVADVPLLLDGQEVARLTTTAGYGSSIIAGGFAIPLDGDTHTLEALLPDGVRLKNNKLYCFGCNAGSPWKTAVETNILGWDSATLGNGFSLYIVEACTEKANFLCFTTGKDEGQEDFRYPGLTRHIALALLYKTAELFMAGLLTGASTNRYTMLEPKAITALMDKYAGEVTTRLAWLNSPEGLGQVQHPCYLGPPSTGPRTYRTT